MSRTGTVALTFDDGPDPHSTPAVLAALARADVSATFFVMTSKVARHPELLAATSAAGHEIGLHCHDHRRHTTMPAEQIARDTDTALSVLHAHGVRPRRWRVPWGTQAASTPAIARDRALTLVHWTADTEDWRGISAPEMLRRTATALGDGAVVLAHDGIGPGAQRTDCHQTAAFVDLAVREAGRRGLRCAPLAEVMVA